MFIVDINHTQLDWLAHRAPRFEVTGLILHGSIFLPFFTILHATLCFWPRNFFFPWCQEVPHEGIRASSSDVISKESGTSSSDVISMESGAKESGATSMVLEQARKASTARSEQGMRGNGCGVERAEACKQFMWRY